MRELQVKSEESLQQLRNFYEGEKERLETRLAEERDRARFLELQLAELVSHHEHLKTQYGDSLTKLGESLRVSNVGGRAK